MAAVDVMHEADTTWLNSEHLVVLLVGPISHTNTNCRDFVKIFYALLDSSSINFARFNGCKTSFVTSFHSVLECYMYKQFPGVKLSVYTSFVISFIQFLFPKLGVKEKRMSHLSNQTN